MTARPLLLLLALPSVVTAEPRVQRRWNTTVRLGTSFDARGLYGIPVLGGSLELSAGVASKQGLLGFCFDLFVGVTPHHLTMAHLAPGFCGGVIAGRFRVEFGVRTGPLFLQRASTVGVAFAWTLGPFMRVMVDLYQWGRRGFYVALRGGFDVFGTDERRAAPLLYHGALGLGVRL